MARHSYKPFTLELVGETLEGFLILSNQKAPQALRNNFQPAGAGVAFTVNPLVAANVTRALNGRTGNTIAALKQDKRVLNEQLDKAKGVIVALQDQLDRKSNGSKY